MMEEWVRGVLENRADKSWTPELVGGYDTAEVYPMLCGYTVRLDESLPERTLQILANGELAAEYTGVPIPVKPAPIEDEAEA